MNIRQLEPKSVWNNFADLNGVPRASKKEDRVIAFIKNFGHELGLQVESDEVGNVLIRKPASKDMENRKGVILQGHLDMVHQKNNDTNFDFDTQGIDMYVDGDWVKARGTTLGADNGLGVAAIMTVLASKDISHPEIEALFTIDEETGMTGALGLKGGWLKGEILLNLDTEEDDEIDIGCAGGIDVTAEKNYIPETSKPGFIGLKISLKGLKGGHSGMDIHKGLGNANKLVNRLLFAVDGLGVCVSEIDGGSLRNAIPRESNVIIAIDPTQESTILGELNAARENILSEYKHVEPNLGIEISKTAVPSEVIPMQIQSALIRTIYAAVNGVYRMSPDIEGLVEASNNVARVEVKSGKIRVLCLTRSSVESSKMDVANALKSVFELGEMTVTFSGEYPGWTPNPDSPILKTLKSEYKRLFEKEPMVVACHAGLECGILGRNYPGLDMISFGPTIKGAHSPDERANIPSTQKFWKYLVEILSNIPEREA